MEGEHCGCSDASKEGDFLPCDERADRAGLRAMTFIFAMPGEVFASHLEAVSRFCVSTTLCPNLNSLEFLEPMVW